MHQPEAAGHPEGCQGRANGASRLCRCGSEAEELGPACILGGSRLITGSAPPEIETRTIRIPMRLQRRGGRKLIMMPEGAALSPQKPGRDETLVKALVRAHRWRRRIESGRVKSITDLAEQEGVTDAYACRLLPLTCLAPDIVEAILDGRQPKGLRLAEMPGNGPLVWEEQRSAWSCARSAARCGADNVRDRCRRDARRTRRRMPAAL
jgi:hypothetical protein